MLWWPLSSLLRAGPLPHTAAAAHHGLALHGSGLQHWPATCTALTCPSPYYRLLGSILPLLPPAHHEHAWRWQRAVQNPPALAPQRAP